MKLYDWRIAPNPRRVRMFLAEKGLSVPIHEVGIPGKMRLNADFMARFDPYATAPTLELDDGTCISEAMAICRYFEDLDPEPPLMGKDALDKAVVEMWERRAYEGPMFAITEMLRNVHEGFVDRGLPGTRDTIPQIDLLVERGQGRLARSSRSLDEQLAKGRFMTGETFTVADITPFCALDFLNRLMNVPIPEDHVHLRRWFADVETRPSVATSA